MKRLVSSCLVLSICLLLFACSKQVSELPKAAVDSSSQFGVDQNINIETIDNYLNRDDTVYRDMRMLFDPADYAAIGGEADLTSSIKGFRVVPYPYIATLSALPVDNAYTGDCLYTVEWNEDGTIKSATENYDESLTILLDLFPKDKNIFLICGGGGYAGMTKTLLIYLGWSEDKIYNVGGAWEYKGENTVELMAYSEDANEDSVLKTWIADYAYIDFTRLHKK